MYNSHLAGWLVEIRSASKQFKLNLNPERRCRNLGQLHCVVHGRGSGWLGHYEQTVAFVSCVRQHPFLFFPFALFARPSAVAGSTSALVAPQITVDRLTAVEKSVADAKTSGDNAWMLTSSALVLLMTGPGLALFYGGLVRKKNVLSTMMQSFALMASITVLWALVGYSLAFGPGNRFIGSFHYLFLHGVGTQPDPDYAATIPARPTWSFS